MKYNVGSDISCKRKNSMNWQNIVKLTHEMTQSRSTTQLAFFINLQRAVIGPSA